MDGKDSSSRCEHEKNAHKDSRPVQVAEDFASRDLHKHMQKYFNQLYFSASRTKLTVFCPLRAYQQQWLAILMLLRKSRKY